MKTSEALIEGRAFLQSTEDQTVWQEIYLSGKGSEYICLAINIARVEAPWWKRWFTSAYGRAIERVRAELTRMQPASHTLYSAVHHLWGNSTQRFPSIHTKEWFAIRDAWIDALLVVLRAEND